MVLHLLKSLGIRRFIKHHRQGHSPFQYSHTPYLPNHTLQSLFLMVSSKDSIHYHRQKIFFPDGGHISLDWVNKTLPLSGSNNVPVIVACHGMTGGSDCRYVKVVAKAAEERKATFVCINNRGFGIKMTSPVPFVWLGYHEFETALNRIKNYFPNRPLHLVGLSMGGNFVMRYLLEKGKDNPLLSRLASVSLLCAPFDLLAVMNGMSPIVQKLFLQSYLRRIVLIHEEMKVWWQSGLVDCKKMKQANTLMDFHRRITSQLVGETADDFFQRFFISGDAIENLPFRTMMIFSKDDPMVSFNTVPIDSVRRNSNIKLIVTETGGHLTWFEGLKPTRWHPKPIFQFIEETQGAWSTSN